jgi:hypothetical protein
MINNDFEYTRDQVIGFYIQLASFIAGGFALGFIVGLGI